MPPEPTPQQRDFVERLGLFFDGLNGQRLIGLIWGWLMVCDPPEQSITEIATALGISKASVSTLIRQLEQGTLVERVPAAGSRQHHYRARPGTLDQMVPRLGRLDVGMAAAEYALSFVPADRVAQRTQLEELRDFFGFLHEEYGEARARRWAEYRARIQARREAIDRPGPRRPSGRTARRTT